MALANGLEVLWIQRCKRWVIVRIVVIHGRNYTVFQSTGNLGIMAVLAVCGGAICDSKGVLDIHRTHH
jgi:hypothetical protein